MDLQALPPDFTFPRLQPADIDFAFEAKRAALGPYIVSRWGWDEIFQREVHRVRFYEKPFLEIRRGDERLGTISISVAHDHIRLGEFYLFPMFQGRGVGSKVLEHCLQAADSFGLPVRLEHLLWNPVRSLYQRQSFVETSRSEIHAFLERSPMTIGLSSDEHR